MKDLKQYIEEKLIVNKHYKQHIYSPKSWKELRQIVEKRFEELGPGTEQEPIDFNDIDVSEMTTFYNHTNYKGIFAKISFEYIDVSEWDVSKVEDMAGMFKNCENLKSVNLSNWDMSNVEDIRRMFENCTNLKSVGDLSKWDVSSVENISDMFANCPKLKSIGDISSWDVSNVKYMDYMFRESGITNIPNWYKE